MRPTLLILFLISFSSFAGSKSDFESLMQKYVKAVAVHDKSTLKAMTGEKYYKQLIKKLPPKQDSVKEKVIFDLTFKKGAHIPNTYLVNIKDKSKKEYSEFWYVFEKKNNSYKIIDMVQVEE